jgi:Ca2+-binding RTX toxin-like protein
VAADVVVTLSKAGAQPISVDYETVDDTATAPSDYESRGPATLTFAPGETEKTISVPVNGDALVEEDESFAVRLSAQSNAELGDQLATVTIVNDDAPKDEPPIVAPGDPDPGLGGPDLGKSLRSGRCRGLKATILGTARSDRRKGLVGTSRRDVIAALGGNDRAEGRGRADSICGGRGADSLRGGRGNDRVRGGVGNDRLIGGKGNDRLIGGKGKDTLIGGPGKDRIYTVGETRDRIRCGGGFDVVYAGFRDKVDKSCERVRRVKRR